MDIWLLHMRAMLCVSGPSCQTYMMSAVRPGLGCSSETAWLELLSCWSLCRKSCLQLHQDSASSSNVKGGQTHTSVYGMLLEASSLSAEINLRHTASTGFKANVLLHALLVTLHLHSLLATLHLQLLRHVASDQTITLSCDTAQIKGWEGM